MVYGASIWTKAGLVGLEQVSGFQVPIKSGVEYSLHYLAETGCEGDGAIGEWVSRLLVGF